MSVIWNERRIRSVRLALEQDAEALFDQALAFAFAWHRSPSAVTQWRRGHAALLRCRKCPAPSSSRERVIVQACGTKIGLPTGLPVAAFHTCDGLSRDSVTRRHAAPFSVASGTDLEAPRSVS